MLTLLDSAITPGPHARLLAHFTLLCSPTTIQLVNPEPDNPGVLPEGKRREAVRVKTPAGCFGAGQDQNSNGSSPEQAAQPPGNATRPLGAQLGQ